MFTATVGQRESERALALGHLYSPAEALKVGLIDEAVAGDKVLEVAEAQLKKWMIIDAGARFVHILPTLPFPPLLLPPLLLPPLMNPRFRPHPLFPFILYFLVLQSFILTFI